jgi:serine/threonine protein kinase
LSSLQELVQTFQKEVGFNQLFSLFLEKYRSYGNIGKNTKIFLVSPSFNERKTLERFFGETYKNESITVTVAKFERAITKTKYKDSFVGHDINDLLQMYYGALLTSKREDKYNFEQKKEQFFQYFMNRSNFGDSFYKFISFIINYSNAPSIHIMYKKNPELLKGLLELINKLFGYLPMSYDAYLPILANGLTNDFHALDPKSNGGKIMLFALQVLNHLRTGTELLSKPNEEQIKEILQDYHIIFCPDASRKTQSLWISGRQNEEENNYQLIPLKKIGEGAFAEVYRVFDPVLKTELACKVLIEKTFFSYGKEGSDYFLRFKREVKFLKEKVSHQNVIKINKIQLVNDPVFFTMPLADASLDKWLQLNPDLSENVRLSIFKDILSGVAYLHDCRISHRDLAPHNILMFKESDGTILVKIADLGLAKDSRSLSKSTGLFVNGYGRAGYTAPEQKISLKNADHISDIYSLGALFYFVLSGKSPEERYRSTVKYQLIVEIAMDEERSKRYQTVNELMDDINLMDKKRVIKEEYQFCNLKTYEFKDLSIDVIHVIECIHSVQIEAPNEVLEKFITPFISIPIDVFVECAKHETVMIPFMYMTEKNIFNAIDLKEVDWDQISILIDSVFIESQNLGLQINAINIIMIVALKLNNLMAQSILVGIIASMTSNTEISQQVKFIIEKSYSPYHKLLITMLQDFEYPSDIWCVLNGY